MKGFAQGFVLKPRYKVTQKWPILGSVLVVICLLAPSATLGDFMISKQSLLGFSRNKGCYCEFVSLVE